MSDNSEEKEFKLKGVIPAKVTTAEEFHESLENLREYHRRSSESFADIFEKNPSLLEEIKKSERQRQIFNEVLAGLAKNMENQPSFKSFADIFEKNPSLLEEIKRGDRQRQIFNEVLASLAKNMENQSSFKSFADIFEKNPSFLEEIKRDERRIQIASEVLASVVNYLEKHPSLLDEVMKESEQELSKEKSSSDC